MKVELEDTKDGPLLLVFSFLLSSLPGTGQEGNRYKIDTVELSPLVLHYPR